MTAWYCAIRFLPVLGTRGMVALLQPLASEVGLAKELQHPFWWKITA